ncbi:MAG: hypothetical protein LBI73_00415 [Myroides sp.]|jgi:hypothetical protein|nr:hypothetical protein [Myroides sp.]
MKKTLLYTAILLFAYSNGHTHPLQKGKAKKITVIDHVVEKNYVPLTEIVSIDNTPTTDKDKKVEAFLSRFDFTYNSNGQINSITSYSIQQGEPVYPFTLFPVVNASNQLQAVKLGTDGRSCDLTIENNLLQQVKYTDYRFQDSNQCDYTYNEKGLPMQAILSSTIKGTQPITIAFDYDKVSNVKTMLYNDEQTQYTYDNKVYALSCLPFSFTVSNFFSNEALIYTTYKQKNNVTKYENDDYTVTITYTYNQNNYPLTAKLTTVSKRGDATPRVNYEYEFHYKDIEIINEKG